jgi:hypothetical protein
MSSYKVGRDVCGGAADSLLLTIACYKRAGWTLQMLEDSAEQFWRSTPMAEIEEDTDDGKRGGEDD